jgi:ankyrin repeat protein
VSADADRDGRTPLHNAVFEGRIAAVRDLIGGGSDVNAKDRGGRTPLHFAAQEYRVEEARLLCAGGAVVDERDMSGNSPLWRATFCSRGRGDLIRLLLDQGANPDMPNQSGVSPRELAARIGNFDVQQFFGA